MKTNKSFQNGLLQPPIDQATGWIVGLNLSGDEEEGYCIELSVGTDGFTHTFPLDAAQVRHLRDRCGSLWDLIEKSTDGFRGIDLGAAVEAKRAYNKTRPYRHGNKLL